MLRAVILVCALVSARDPSACTRDTAIDVMVLPIESALPAQCLALGQEYLAHSAIGADLSAGEWVKIACVRAKARD